MVNVPVFAIHSKGGFVEIIEDDKRAIYGLKEEDDQIQSKASRRGDAA